MMLRKYILLVLITGIISALVGFYGFYPLYSAYRVAYPVRQSICCRTPADEGLTYEPVSFTSRDGLRLFGWYLPSQRRSGGKSAAIILAHGHGGVRTDNLNKAEFLVRHGYAVLLYDLPGHGESEGTRAVLDGQDVMAAVDLLKSFPDVDGTRIGAWGISLGGFVCLQAAAQDIDIRAVIVDGPFPVVTAEDSLPPRQLEDWLWFPFDRIKFWMIHSMGVFVPASQVSSLPRIFPRPILLVAGAALPAERRLVERYYAAAKEPKFLWIAPGAGHAAAWNILQGEYERRVLSFFNRELMQVEG